MTVRYHVTVSQHGDKWRAVCPALRHHGASVGGETREEALTHIENAILMILTEMERNFVSPPADEPVAGGILLAIATE
jgi:predicted RNase H-like HicB family nuclease